MTCPELPPEIVERILYESHRVGVVAAVRRAIKNVSVEATQNGDSIYLNLSFCPSVYFLDTIKTVPPTRMALAEARLFRDTLDGVLAPQHFPNVSIFSFDVRECRESFFTYTITVEHKPFATKDEQRVLENMVYFAASFLHCKVAFMDPIYRYLTCKSTDSARSDGQATPFVAYP